MGTLVVLTTVVACHEALAKLFGAVIVHSLGAAVAGMAFCCTVLGATFAALWVLLVIVLVFRADREHRRRPDNP